MTHMRHPNRSVRVRPHDRVACIEGRLVAKELPDEVEYSSASELDVLASEGHLMSLLYADPCGQTVFGPTDCSAHEALASWQMTSEEVEYFSRPTVVADNIIDLTDDAVACVAEDAPFCCINELAQGASYLGTPFHYVKLA